MELETRGARAAVVRSSLIAALGGLLFGFDTAVISGTTEDLRRVFLLGDAALGFTVASALIGTILGALVAGWPADRWGRRATLAGVAVLYFVSAVGCAWPWDWASLLFFRFIGGIGVGGASVVCPLYIAEIAPASRRGRLVALSQFNVVLGILLAYLSNWLIGERVTGGDAWRWMFGVEAVPAAMFFGLLFLTPESPRWLIAKGRLEEAALVLARIGVDGGSIDDHLGTIRRSILEESAGRPESLFSKRYRRPVLLAVAMAAFNQLSGVNAIIYYTPDIFRMAGFDRTSSLVQSVVIGGTNLALTMLGLSLIDRFGRRTLMLAGSIGYLASLSATAYSYYSGTGGALLLGSLVVFIASHAFGQGAVIWVFLSEIFPNRVRAKGTALGSTVHWIMAAAISWTFPLIASRSGGHTFSVYALCMAGQLIWVLTTMPETKGVPLEAMEKEVLLPVSRIVAIGELLWDLLPDGKQLGGAPGNLVHHARSLGAEAVLISRVGRDALGDEAASRMAGMETIQRDDTAPTGTAAVSVDPEGQPRFTLAADVAWDRIEVDEPARRAVARADAVTFGTLAQRSPGSRATIRTLLGACRPDALRVLDLNLRDPFWTEEIVLGSFQAANVVKVNEDELDRCSGMLKLSGTVRERIEALSRRFGLKLVAVTRGSRGSLLSSEGAWSDHPGLSVKVRDAVGAGDAFTAALTLGLLRGHPLDRINRHANEVGAFVCTQPGATPSLPEELTSPKESS